VGTRDNSTSTTKPFRGPGVVEGSSFAVELHILGVDARTVHPRVLLARQPLVTPDFFGQTNVQVALSSFNEHDLEIVVQVGQTACHDTTT
jgi:hypothetical protein